MKRNEKGQFIEGSVPWNKNKKLSLSHRKKLRLSHLGKKYDRGPWNLIKFKCKNCGKIFYDFPSDKRTYCSKCAKFRQIKYKCCYCKKEFFGHRSSRHKYCSVECVNKDRVGKKRPKSVRKKVIENIPRGKDHYNYKGGVYSEDLYIKIRHSLEMREWRRKVFERDNYTCQKCKKKGGYLEPHHIKLFIKILNENNIKSFEQALRCKELWNIDNGKTLCKKCHNLTKGIR